MMRTRGTFAAFTHRIAFGFAIVLVALLGLAAPAAHADDAKDSQICVTCHDEDDLADFSRSAHGFTGDKRAPQCTTCHGASPTHAKKPDGVPKRPAPDITFSKKSVNSALQQSGACLTCHDRQAKRMHWQGSAHQAADIACSSCHQVHANHDKALAKQGQTDLCFTCHKEQRAQMARPSHHPVPEGKMACSDCHNPHGSAGPKLAKRDSTNATCFQCHAEKRGPFVHPHDPVVEDCANCHNPHGSTVSAMLTTRPPLLCQQCHTPHVAGSVGALAGQPGVKTLAPGQVSPLVTGVTGGKNVVNMWQGRSCMNCHTQVHGTNNPSVTSPTPNLLLR